MTQHLVHHRTELLVGPEGLERLLAARVIVFGVGGVGSWCAEALARTAVGHLTLVDSDLVCITNVNRQLQATPKNVGRSKVQELAVRLTEVAPSATIEALHKVYDASTSAQFDLGRYDCVVDAIDSVSSKVHLLMAATEAQARVFSAMGAACKLDASRVKVASIWKTEGCALAREVRKLLRKHGFAADFSCVYSDEAPIRGRAESFCGSGECVCPRESADPSVPSHDWCSSKKVVNGSVAHMTAIFGMHLTGLVVNHLLSEKSR